MRSKSYAVELVDVVEDGQVHADGCDLAGRSLRLHDQPFPYAA